MDDFEALAIAAAAKKKKETTPAEAGANVNAIETLKTLVERGEARPAEIAELEKLQGTVEADKDVLSETDARYRGFVHDLTAGQRDTAAGVASWLKGDGYEVGRDEVREADRAAMEAHPEAFNKGRIAGSGALGGGTLLFGGPFLKGANWLTKSVAGAGTGSGIAFNQAVQDEQLKGNSPESLGDYLQVAKDNWKPIAVGAGLGGGAYPFAATAGSGVRGIARMLQKPLPNMTRKASRIFRGVTDDALESGADIQRYLDDLTDEAMLADVPEFRSTAQGLAAQGGKGGKRVMRALTERADSNAARITDDLNTHITGPDAAFDARRANAVERASVLGPEYDAALASQSPVGTDRVAQALAMQSDAVGAPAGALKRISRDLGIKPDVIGPQSPVSATKMHNVRSNLSDDLDAAYQAGRRKFSTQVKPALTALNETLDEVPGYADARTGYGNNKAMDDAIKAGVDALDSGRKTSKSPAEFAADFSKLSEPQKDAVRKGLRSQVARIMGTSRNDAAAAWGEFAKDWNAEKLRIVLGDEAADPLIKRLRSENVFSETRGAVNAGSQTDFRRSARKMLEPVSDETTGQQIGPIKRAKTALFDKPVNAAVDSVLYGPRAGRANLELGNALSATGAERDAIVRALLQDAARQQRGGTLNKALIATINALIKGGGAATSGALVSNQ